MLRGPTFKLLGVPVRVEIWFFVATLFLGLDRIRGRDNPLFWLAEWFVVVAVSILVHEFGHAFAYRRYGQRASIVLWGLGGLTFGQQILPPRKRIVVSLAGPFAEILLLGIPAQLALTAMRTSGSGFSNPDLYAVISDVAWLNLAWALVNLLPLLPLDGGNVCDAVLEIRHGEPRRQTTRIISIVTGFAFGLFSLVYWGSTFGLMFGWILAAVNLFQYLQVRRGGQFGGTQFQLFPESGAADESPNVVSMDSARKKRDRRSPAELVQGGYGSLEHRDYKGALRTADRLGGKRLSGSVAGDATELAAWAWLGQRNPVKAHEVLEGRPKNAAISRPLSAVLALADKQTDLGVELMVESLVHDTDGPSRLIGVDLFAEYGTIHRLARDLVDLPGGTGFEAAVALEGLLHRLNRTQDASTVSDVIMLG